MRTLILTIRLLDNYGGLLQNYALQKVLQKNGYDAITADYVNMKFPPFWKFFLSWIKSVFLFFRGKPRHFTSPSDIGKRSPLSENFVRNFISKTRRLHTLNSLMVKDYNVSAIIVGSDQVWRPRYNRLIEDMFLKFTQKLTIKRIAYAASFGVDNWEYTQKQTHDCSELAKKFDAISIREESGVKLCKEHLGVDATWVLDPTLLLTKEDYLPICEEIPVCNEKYLAVYALDDNEEVTDSYEKEALIRGLVVKKFHAEAKSTLTVPEWLAMFRDASYVVTDSFHGTVFSIIFGKEFKCIYNNARGAARFESLLNLYHSGRLEEMREFSLNWLKAALEN